MTFATIFERAVDRIAPALFLALGMTSALATAFLGA